MLVIVNPYHRSVTIDGEEVVQKVLEFPNTLNHLSTISCTYDSESHKITKVHDLHRFTSNFIQREYFFDNLPEFVTWFYAEKQAQIEEAAKQQKYKEDVENAITQTVKAGEDAQEAIATDKANAISNIESTYNTASNNIAAKRAEAINTIQSTKTESLDSITATTNSSLASITNVASTALNEIDTEKASAISAIAADKADALSSIATDRRSSLDEINSSINKATIQADRAKFYADNVAAVANVEPATKESRGLVQIGDNIDVDETGTISVDLSGVATALTNAANAQETADNAVEQLVPATQDSLGLVQVGDNLSITEDGVLSADAQVSIATAETAGIVKPSGDITVDAEGVLTDKREVLYYESMPEEGLPTEGIKEGAIAFIDDAASHISEKIFYGGVWRDSNREAYARLPIATVIASMSNVTPHGFLHMNGDTFAVPAFPDLAHALNAPEGATTFTLPNGLGRVLWGSDTAGQYIEAGLPNITGGNEGPYTWIHQTSSSGCFSQEISEGGYGGTSTGSLYRGNIVIDASRSNSTYGNSDTVQPPALTVRYYIKAYDVAISESQAQVAGLIDTVQGKANDDLSNVTQATKDRLLSENFTIIYPNGGTAKNPANVTTNSRYVMDNPFSGYEVYCVAEIYLYNRWGDPCIDGNAGTSTNGYGTKATVNGGKIIVQTGVNAIGLPANMSGNGFNEITHNTNPTTAPCRVKVWKVGKI